jgi:hypothetical protein
VRAKTFTWVITPKGKRVKAVLPLDERLSPYLDLFVKKIGVSPRVVFMRTEMTKDWEYDSVLGMEIIRLNKGYPLHHYSFAVTKKDFKVTGDSIDVPD